jgi:hypothetical protein
MVECHCSPSALRQVSAWLVTASVAAAAAACAVPSDAKDASASEAVALSAPLYTLDKALRLGAVDFVQDPWRHRTYAQTVNQIAALGPGAIFEIGFLYGGVNQQFLTQTAEVAGLLRAKLPQTLLGARFPEALRLLNSGENTRVISCGPSNGTFSYDNQSIMESMIGPSYFAGAYWIDPRKQKTKEYLVCLGKAYIDSGFTMIGFTYPFGNANALGDPGGTYDAMRDVQAQLNRYADAKGATLIWGGDAESSMSIATDYAYEPMRVYDAHSYGAPYRNQISRPDVGVGYSYALSQAIITARKAATPNPATKLIFYVDNYDPNTDDLRRFTELDSRNRRFMMLESMRQARANGVSLSLPLTHCEGCIPAVAVVDQCHLVPGVVPSIASYEAFACGDFPVISAAFRFNAQADIATSVDFVNSFGVCSTAINQLGVCTDNCIYHDLLYVAPVQSPLLNQTSANSALVRFAALPNGYCLATSEEGC